MVEDVSVAVYKYGFDWKFASLEFMLCGSLRTLDVDELSFIVPGTFVFKRVVSMEILGACISEDANVMLPVERRLCKASALYWKHATVLRGPGSPVRKLHAWSRGASYVGDVRL